MPTIAEKAKAEAEQAEAEEREEQQTEEQPAEPEPELVVEPEPHPGDGLEEPTDTMMVELGAACNDHHDHVRAIMGPFVASFVPCETCNGIGLAYPPPATPTLEPAPGLQLCTVCKGPGELATPSTRSGYDVIQCTNCGGRGYTGAMPTQGSAAVAQAVEQYPANEGNGVPLEQVPQPQTTDPFVLEAERQGYIVLKKPGA